MLLIDRYILSRFLANFIVLLALLFLFGATVELILSLEKFIEAAQTSVHPDANLLSRAGAFLALAADFQLPRIFQLYAYLHGLVAVGAMAFTLAQMVRHRELVALLAAGVSLQRVAMPFILGIFALCILQILNQEFMLPRVAPLLLRDHGQIGEVAVERFPVPFTPDANGHLLHAVAFDPRTDTLSGLTFIERDERGRAWRRTTAASAKWQEGGRSEDSSSGWVLEQGRSTQLGAGDAPADAPAGTARYFPTSLSPEVLIVRRYGEYAGMLSLRQIDRLLNVADAGDDRALRRHRSARFAIVLVNVLVMWLALPTFLLRLPQPLLVRSLLCAGITIPSLFGAAIFMAVNLPGIPPAVGVFLPVVVLIPLVFAHWTYVRT